MYAEYTGTDGVPRRHGCMEPTKRVRGDRERYDAEGKGHCLVGHGLDFVHDNGFCIKDEVFRLRRVFELHRTSVPD